jgi:hypothetical protein
VGSIRKAGYTFLSQKLIFKTSLGTSNILVYSVLVLFFI